MGVPLPSDGGVCSVRFVYTYVLLYTRIKERGGGEGAKSSCLYSADNDDVCRPLSSAERGLSRTTILIYTYVCLTGMFGDRFRSVGEKIRKEKKKIRNRNLSATDTANARASRIFFVFLSGVENVQQIAAPLSVYNNIEKKEEISGGRWGEGFEKKCKIFINIIHKVLVYTHITREKPRA